MTEFNVEVVKLDKTEPHPNADTLSIAHIFGGYPVVYKTESFATGDKVVYIPIDSLVPVQDERFSFLATGDKERVRIKAKKLRGVFSMGMLVPADPTWDVGQNVQEALNITKWEPAPPKSQRNINAYSEQEQGPGNVSVYTDLESLRRYPDVLKVGEEVILTEKIHGCNARYVYTDNRFWAGSHRTFKKPDSRNLWWQVAEKYNLEKKLYEFQDLIVYGEIYGAVQDLKYGLKPDEVKLAVFDLFAIPMGRFLPYENLIKVCQDLHLPLAPMLHQGPWNPDMTILAEGKSTIADHVREGFVVRPKVERYDPSIGRCILKLVGQDYLLRKESAA